MSNLCYSKRGGYPAAWEPPRELAGNAVSNAALPPESAFEQDSQVISGILKFQEVLP